jgi:hypothetical protein
MLLQGRTAGIPTGTELAVPCLHIHKVHGTYYSCRAEQQGYQQGQNWLYHAYTVRIIVDSKNSRDIIGGRIGGQIQQISI